MSKLTSVEWLILSLENPGKLAWGSIKEKAKEMHKQEIIIAYDDGNLSDMQYPDPNTIVKNGEQYYTKTFKNDIKEDDVEKLAKLFHDTYEKLAPSFGYTTREETKVFDKNSPNGKLMIATIKELKAKEKTYTEEEIDKLLSFYTDDAPASYIKRDYKKYLQSLKQPKQ